MKKSKKLTVILLSFVLVITTFIPVSVSAEEIPSYFTPEEWKVLILANKARASEGIYPVSGFDKLQNASRVRASELKGNFSYTRPGSGSTGYTAVSQAGISAGSARYWCEIIANGSALGTDIYNAWMGDDTSSNRLLSKNKQHMSVAANDTYWDSFLIGGCAFSSMKLLNADGSGRELDGNGALKGYCGDTIDSYNLMIECTCEHGKSYMPVVGEMCSGYHYYNQKQQKVTIKATDRTFTTNIKVSHKHTSEITQAPTCEETGIRTYTCKCGNNYKETVPAKGHTWDAGVSTITDCTEGEHVLYTCSECGIKREEVLEPQPHKATTPATCTKDSHCSVCGMLLTPALGHEYGEWTIVKEATANEDGSRKCSCNRCNREKIEPIDALLKPSQSITFANKKVTLNTVALRLNATAFTPITYSGDNDEVAQIEESGLTHIIGIGRVNVTALAERTQDYRPASMTAILTVTPDKVNVKASSTKSGRATVKWTPAEGAVRYQTNYATNKKFTKGKRIIRDAQYSGAYIKKLARGKTYYFRVRACARVDDEYIYGPWSKAVKTKIKY